MKKGQLDNLILNLQLIFKVLKNETKEIDAFQEYLSKML